MSKAWPNKYLKSVEISKSLEFFSTVTGSPALQPEVTDAPPLAPLRTLQLLPFRCSQQAATDAAIIAAQHRGAAAARLAHRADCRGCRQPRPQRGINLI